MKSHTPRLDAALKAITPYLATFGADGDSPEAAADRHGFGESRIAGMIRPIEDKLLDAMGYFLRLAVEEESMHLRNGHKHAARDGAKARRALATIRQLQAP